MYMRVSRKERENRAEALSRHFEGLQERSLEDKVTVCDFAVNTFLLLFLLFILFTFFLFTGYMDIFWDLLWNRFGTSSTYLSTVLFEVLPAVIMLACARPLFNFLVRWRIKRLPPPEVQPPGTPSEELPSAEAPFTPTVGDFSSKVIEHCGKPKKINRRTANGRIIEQWIYDYMYVYVQRGTVAAWQPNKDKDRN